MTYRPTMAHPYARVHGRLWIRPCFCTSAPYLICLTCMIYEIRGKWPYSCCFVGYCFLDLFKTAFRILVKSPIIFFLCFFWISMWYIHTVVWIQHRVEEIPFFILSDIFHFYMIGSLLIAFHAFAKHMLISLLVDEILPARYVNW